MRRSLVAIVSCATILTSAMMDAHAEDTVVAPKTDLEPLPAPLAPSPPPASAVPAPPAPSAANESDATPLPLVRDDYPMPKLSIEGTLGWGTPLGFLGAGASYAATKWFAVAGGVGAGAQGTQWAASIRISPFQFSRSETALAPRKGGASMGFEVGWSSGPYATLDSGNRDHRYLSHAHWLNGAVQWYLWEKAFSVRPFVGGGAMLNIKDSVCASFNYPSPARRCSPKDEGAFVLFGGVSLGFGLF